MRDVPFSAFLLLLIGVIGLAGYLTGNIWTWFGALTGAPPSGPPPLTAPAVGGALAYAGNLRGSGRVA